MKKWIEPKIQEVSVEDFGGISLFGTCSYRVCGVNYTKTNAASYCGGFSQPQS